ncbi:MAG TPA: septal ring lytic transglycosylase RlpA family protein [Acidimicrobiales bacterium]|jgi:rare lipoprotein A|nr:septal ring lytic transglycosylase RlpA family protein [Acidimicrobiales bacterium]
MVAGGALYVRHPGRHPATAVRVASGGSYRPSAAAGQPLRLAGAASAYDLVTDLRHGTIPSTTAPAPATQTTDPKRAAATATTPTTTVAAAVPAGSTSPFPSPTAPAPPTTTPLTPLLQAIVPAAAAVLGLASWFDAPPGTCAHRDLPLGTIVKVTRVATGASTTCRVSDRGPSTATNRVIDLSQGTFAELASTDAGVIEVRIEW